MQSPEPPEVTPCAWLPEMNEPPESPGSAHTEVRVTPATVPSWYVTLVLSCCTVPQCQPVVDPERHTEEPTVACTEPATCALEPLTYGVARQLAFVATQAMSLPGKIDAWNVPCAVWSKPVVVLPACPQCPAVAKPCWVPRVTGKPIEQRALLSM